MCNRIKKSTLKHLFIWALICFLPAMSWATLVVNTKVVSGNIVQHNADHSVRLDDGKTYYPSRTKLSINLPVGKAVTLRYFVETQNKYFFFEYAPGMNSLQEIQPPTPEKDTRIK
jgi:hypothetical protein